MREDLLRSQFPSVSSARSFTLAVATLLQSTLRRLLLFPFPTFSRMTPHPSPSPFFPPPSRHSSCVSPYALSSITLLCFFPCIHSLTPPIPFFRLFHAPHPRCMSFHWNPCLPFTSTDLERASKATIHRESKVERKLVHATVACGRRRMQGFFCLSKTRTRKGKSF